MTAEDKKTCFIAMPITTHPDEVERYGGDTDHWIHVMETIFVPAIERAGFKPLRPQAVGSDMIHGHIVRALEKSDMVLCDLSGHNPNVFFELGVRTSLNKPVTLVKDEHLGFPFDTGVLNTHAYSSSLSGWEVAAEVDRLARHIGASEATCAGKNPMWRHFGLTMAAEKPASDDASASDAKIELVFEGMQELRREIAAMRDSSGLSAGSIDQFGRIPEGILLNLHRLADDLSPILGRELRHIGRGRTRTDYNMRFEGFADFASAGDLESRVASAAEARGYRLMRMSDVKDNVIVVVRTI